MLRVICWTSHSYNYAWCCYAECNYVGCHDADSHGNITPQMHLRTLTKGEWPIRLIASFIKSK
jgi:hypothetical protein